MPVERVNARKVVAAVIAEADLEGVRLRGLAVPFELVEVLEIGLWAEAALDRLDCPTRDVGLRSLEEQPMLWLDLAGDSK